MNGRSIGYRTLFGVVYATSISSVYFALGVIGRRAGGLTPAVFLVAGLFFVLTAMTYAEGASLHQERGGSAMFARYAFNELVSFVAGWSIFLDYTILLAVTALVIPAYLAAFWAPLGHGTPQVMVALAVIGLVAADAITGPSFRGIRRRVLVAAVDLLLQAAIVLLGLALIFHPHRLTAAVHLGTQPRARDLLFALPVGVIAFTGLEAAANLAAETRATAREVRRLVIPGSIIIVAVSVAIALIAVGSLPVRHGRSELGLHHLEAPTLGVAAAFHPHWLAVLLRYAVGAAATLSLTAAARGSMLGVSRVGYSLATNRQIPSAVGRLSGRFGSPYVVIGVAAVGAGALVLPADLPFLVDIYAFGALIAFTIAHLSVVRLRLRDGSPERGYRVPGALSLRGRQLPLPAVAGSALALGGWVAIVVLHPQARLVGSLWLAGGLVLYVGYRLGNDKPLLRRVTIPEQALRDEPPAPDFGSILVPIMGTTLDDDIMQTAARLAGERHDDVDEEGAVIEAIAVIEMPLALPLDAPLPEARVRRAREALARARQVGEEYEGVQVATALVRARRAGEAIVAEAVRRGVEAIVLAAEPPSRVRGGALLGGGSPESSLGELTRAVVRKAPCRVIITAAPGTGQASPPPAAPARVAAPPPSS